MNAQQRRRNRRRRRRAEQKGKDRLIKACPNCGKKGPHFVPPCFGDPGFFVCEPERQGPGSYVEKRQERAIE